MEKEQTTLAKPPVDQQTDADSNSNQHADSMPTRSVMDVKPRGKEDQKAVAQPTPVPPPPDENSAGKGKETEAEAPANKTPAKDNKPKQDMPKLDKPAKSAPAPRPPKQPGVGLAIFSTTVIVLGISALVVFAYLKSQ